MALADVQRAAKVGEGNGLAVILAAVVQDLRNGLIHVCAALEGHGLMQLAEEGGEIAIDDAAVAVGAEFLQRIQQGSDHVLRSLGQRRGGHLVAEEMLQIQQAGGADDEQDVLARHAIAEVMHLVGEADENAALGEGVGNTVTKAVSTATDHIYQLDLVVDVGGEIHIVILAQIQLRPNLTE